MKKVVTFIAAVALSLGALIFADDNGMYAKINAGWASGSIEVDAGNGFTGSTSFRGFEIMPAFGIAPEITSFSDMPFDFTFEASLDLIFGKGSEWDEVKTTSIMPGITCFFNWHFENTDSEFLKHFVPYAGAGFALPIQIVSVKHSYWTTRPIATDPYYEYYKETFEDSSTVLGFDLTFMVGARYALTDKIEVNAESGYNCISLDNWFFRTGIFYHF